MSVQELENPLSSYGEYLVIYEGTTILTQAGFKGLECKFEARQLNKGNIVIWIRLPINSADSLMLSFYLMADVDPLDIQGITKDGWIFFNKIVKVSEYPTVNNEGTTDLVLEASQMTVTSPNFQNISQLRFGLTNFFFKGNKNLDANNTTKSILALTLQNSDKSQNIEFHRLDTYMQIEARLRKSKGIEVTCEAHFNELGDKMGDNFQTIEDICFLLSVLRGCLINWIYCLYYDTKGNIVKMDHQNRITKPYGSLALIHDSHSEVQPDDTKNFIEQTFKPYTSKRDSYKLNKGAIYSYLAAKAEGDLLESRGVKVAVAIEMLKDLFLKSEGITRTLIEEKEFNKLRKKIQSALSKVLEEFGLKEKEREEMYKKLGELNNKTFEDILLQFLEKVKLNIQDGDIKRFIRSRNSLVHTGQFYCETATEADRKKVPPHKDVREEYFFLLNFIDKLFMKFLNYDGPYIDRSIPIGIGTYKTSVSQP